MYSSHLLLLRSRLGLGTFLRGPLGQTPGDELVPLHQPHEPAFGEPPRGELHWLFALSSLYFPMASPQVKKHINLLDLSVSLISPSVLCPGVVLRHPVSEAAVTVETLDLIT